MLEPATIAALVGIGLVGGVASGLFGVGGGIVMVPLLLVALPGLGFKEAKAASLLVTFAAAFVAVAAHRRKRSVDLRRGALLAACGAVGAILSVLLAEHLADRTLRVAFGVVLVAVAIRLVADVAPRPRDVRLRTSVAAVACVGFVAGLLAGFFGIGGGVVMVPALVFLGSGMHLAVGTSLVAVGTNAVAGTAVHATLGYGGVFLALGFPLAAGALPGGSLGAYLAHRLDASRLQRVFGVFLAIVGGYLAATA